MKKSAILFSGLLLAAVFVFGLARLFQLRFDRGDVYAPYSTLRTDPLGTSVFYESLARVPGVSSRRYFEKTFNEENGRDRALFILGTYPYQLGHLSRSEFNAMQQFVYSGGRVVIACFPEVAKTYSTRQKEQDLEQEKKTKLKKIKKEKSIGKSDENDEPAKEDGNPDKSMRQKKDGDKKDEDQDSVDDWSAKVADLREEWGFRADYENLATNDDGKIEFPLARLAADGHGELPAEISVHSALYFSRLTNGWTTVYQRETLPVIVERRFGKGSVILAADTYWFSNEALFRNRSTELLSWMLGSGREAIFDEAHLGVVTDTGIAALMRKYRLHGLVFSLVLLSGLFIWKNSLSLVPPQPDGADANGVPVIEGKDSIAGFVNLLRRGIPRSEIVTACVDEWKKSGGRRAAMSAAQRQQIDQIVARENELPARRRNPVETYRAICEVMKRKK